MHPTVRYFPENCHVGSFCHGNYSTRDLLALPRYGSEFAATMVPPPRWVLFSYTPRRGLYVGWADIPVAACFGGATTRAQGRLTSRAAAGCTSRSEGTDLTCVDQLLNPEDIVRILDPSLD